MRDRETDSWWSIMSSDAIGGPLDGAELKELPVGEKAQWRDWVSRHPHTLVLSIDGEEHVAESPYEEYFASEGTFRDLEVADRRLSAKEPIFGAWIDGRPQAIAHSSFGGGALFPLPDDRRLLLYRATGSSMFASSRAYLLSGATSVEATPVELLRAIDHGETEAEAVSGFDTFWYSWVTVNEDSGILP